MILLTHFGSNDIYKNMKPSITKLYRLQVRFGMLFLEIVQNREFQG